MSTREGFGMKNSDPDPAGTAKLREILVKHVSEQEVDVALNHDVSAELEQANALARMPRGTKAFQKNEESPQRKLPL